MAERGALAQCQANAARKAAHRELRAVQIFGRVPGQSGGVQGLEQDDIVESVDCVRPESGVGQGQSNVDGGNWAGDGVRGLCATKSSRHLLRGHKQKGTDSIRIAMVLMVLIRDGGSVSDVCRILQ